VIIWIEQENELCRERVGREEGEGLVCVRRSNGSQIASEKQVYDVRIGSERMERSFECFPSWIFPGMSVGGVCVCGAEMAGNRTER
jgi:hypothetical protein